MKLLNKLKRISLPAIFFLKILYISFAFMEMEINALYWHPISRGVMLGVWWVILGVIVDNANEDN